MAGKRIAVMGTGASGASIGADLTRAGLDVTLIEQWPAHVEAMRAKGIRIEMPEQTLTTPVRAFNVCEAASLQESFDVVLIVVKAYDTRWACELIKPLTSPTGLVVGLQNGMTMDDIASIMGPERTLGAVVEIAANMFEPGIVDRQTPPSGTWFAIGAYDATTQGRESEVVEILRHAGKVEISDDIRSAKWMKLIVNAAECLPSAILNLPLREAVETPGIRDVMAAAGVEATRTALALGQRQRLSRRAGTPARFFGVRALGTPAPQSGRAVEVGLPIGQDQGNHASHDTIPWSSDEAPRHRDTAPG